MDSVSLTVTPASAANSVESGGIRVDGWDVCSQPIPAGRVGANWGWVRFRWIPRHNDADALKFGNSTPNIFYLYGDMNNRVYPYYTAASSIVLSVWCAGVNTSGTWNTGGLMVAGGNYLMEIRYTPTNVFWYVDGVLRLTLTPVAGINFTFVPTALYVGGQTTPTGVVLDSVYLAP